MELPFKYMVLNIMKTFSDRNMPLVIDRYNLVNYITEFMKKAYFTIEEKKHIGEDFDFNYELDSLITEYYEYFDIEDDKIIFDSNYADELNDLILNEREKIGEFAIYNIDVVIDNNTSFLDIIGVRIRKELYHYLLEIENDIEDNYMKLCDLEIYNGSHEVNNQNIINDIKMLNMKRTILLLNARNLLSSYEQYDLIQYASGLMENESIVNSAWFLIYDEKFGEMDVMYDPFQRSIFTAHDSSLACLREKLDTNLYGTSDDRKYNIIRFYLTFIELLEKEIDTYNELLGMELIKIKYRLMYTLDSVYDMSLFMNNKSYDKIDVKENYKFIEYEIYYLIKELLMYDDEKYRNKDFDMDNEMVYLNNIVKKLLIETYYILTNDKNVVNSIRNNKLFGVNAISSGFLREIIDKPKRKIK